MLATNTNMGHFCGIVLGLMGHLVTGQVLDGAGGLQGWMERMENLPGVSFSESFMFSHDWKYHIISDPTNLIGTLKGSIPNDAADLMQSNYVKVSKYLSSRPDVVGVGENPRLQPKI